MPSRNWLLKSEDKQFAQLAQVKFSPFFFFFFFSLQSFSCVCFHLRAEATRVIRLCLVHFTFWISHGLVVLLFSLFWLSRQSVYHMESVGRKTVSSVFLIGRPPALHLHTHTHTINPPCFPLPFSRSPFSPCFSSLTAKSAEPNDRKLTSQPNS